jgi:large subunit ribosomal protein L1
MGQIGKKLADVQKKVEREKKYGLDEALSLVKELAYAKFDESVDVAVRLGVNPKHSDQMVRGTVVLPAGTGKQVRVLVFAKGEKEKEAKEAGADYVGAEDLVEKINQGWLDFDQTIATPDLMGLVGKLGKVLGPRGMMPNAKTGTVTFDIKKAVQDIKAGKVDFKVEKNGIVHLAIGKVSFSLENLKANTGQFFETLVKLKPATSKGQYLRSISISSTMGPGVKVDPVEIANTYK